MRIRHSHSHGSTLVIVIMATGIIFLTLASYLTLVQTHSRINAQSRAWNTAFPAAEAGVEEALGHLSRSYNASLSVDDWTFTNGVYTKPGKLPDGGTYSMMISGGPSNFVIQSTGTVPAYVGSRTVSRTLLVGVSVKFRHTGMVSRSAIGLAGGMDADSYDSSDPLYSTNGLYTTSKRKDGAFIATNTQTNNVTIGGSVNIKGRVATGPGGTITAGGGASIGDMSWNSKGIQPGHTANDMNAYIPDVEAPFAFAIAPVPGIVNGTNYNFVLTGGNYILPSLTGSFAVTAPSVLYVTGNVSLSDANILKGASVDLYVAGASTKAVNVIHNENSDPLTFNYYGLPSNTYIKFGGNIDFIGTIYAPNATYDATGTSDLYGGIAVKNMSSGGSFFFHFDENLLRQGAKKGMLITFWDEI